MSKPKHVELEDYIAEKQSEPPPASEPKPKRKRKKTATVQHIARDARKLVTFDAGHHLWEFFNNGTQTLENTSALAALDGLEGAIVRLRPPAGLSEGAVQRFENAVNVHKPFAMKVLPPESEGATIVNARREKPAPEMSTRQLVLHMADESNSRDVDALKELLGEVMDQEEV